MGRAEKDKSEGTSVKTARGKATGERQRAGDSQWTTLVEHNSVSAKLPRQNDRIPPATTFIRSLVF